MPSQREQYGSTVHLFIGTGRSPCKITFINNSIAILRGLIWLFIFKSVPLFCRRAEAFLHVASWSSYPSLWLLSAPVKLRLDYAFVHPQPDSEGTYSHVSLGKYCQIMFLRTFGSWRPPTTCFPSGKHRQKSSLGLPTAVFIKSVKTTFINTTKGTPGGFIWIIQRHVNQQLITIKK
jgi:hypothetical protein